MPLPALPGRVGDMRFEHLDVTPALVHRYGRDGCEWIGRRVFRLVVLL